MDQKMGSMPESQKRSCMIICSDQWWARICYRRIFDFTSLAKFILPASSLFLVSTHGLLKSKIFKQLRIFLVNFDSRNSNSINSITYRHNIYEGVSIMHCGRLLKHVSQVAPKAPFEADEVSRRPQFGVDTAFHVTSLTERSLKVLLCCRTLKSKLSVPLCNPLAGNQWVSTEEHSTLCLTTEFLLW
jgi:hypothetical protein